MRWQMELCTSSTYGAEKNLPGSYCIRLREIFACHFTHCPYYPPMTEACGKNDWSPANNLTKETIYNDKFWTEIQTLLRQVVVRNGAEVIHDPFAKYLTLMRKLMLQIIAWQPIEIERPDDMAREAQMLHHKIGLSKKPFRVVLHYFFEHLTERLKHHGSLMRIACEGGEHLHQPHAAVVRRRPSRPRRKCPVGLREVMKKERLRLALWRRKWVVPAFLSSKRWCRTFLKKCRVKGYLSLPWLPKHILQAETRSYTLNPPTYIHTRRTPTRTHTNIHRNVYTRRMISSSNDCVFYCAAALDMDPLPAPPCLCPSLHMHLCHVSHLSFPHNLSIYVCRWCCRSGVCMRCALSPIDNPSPQQMLFASSPASVW